MKTVLCFGDSNTWGSPPGGVGRHSWDVRWPGILQQALGATVRVIEEGLGGRTTCLDDPTSPDKNGLSHLPILLKSHSPIRLLVIMLGTNDLKKTFNVSASQIAEGAGALLSLATLFEPRIDDILLVSPPHTVRTPDRALSEQFEGGVERSMQLAEHYQRVAEKFGCHFFDGASVARSSPVDGIHLDAENHRALARGVTAVIATILGVQA